MSILIKDMQMPRNEPLLIKLNPDGSVSTTARNGYRKYAAIPVPPHERLIDADALFETMERTGWNDNADRDIAEDIVLDAPTIIPASKEV